MQYYEIKQKIIFFFEIERAALSIFAKKLLRK